MGKSNKKSSASWLGKTAQRGFRGYPIATVAFYGPTADLATKVVVAIVRDKGCEPDRSNAGSPKMPTCAPTPLSASASSPS